MIPLGRFKSSERKFCSKIVHLNYRDLSDLNDEHIALGIATGNPVPATYSSSNAITYRLYSGQVYNDGVSIMTIEKSHNNDIITFVFSPQNANLKILKVNFGIKFKSSSFPFRMAIIWDQRLSALAHSIIR